MQSGNNALSMVNKFNDETTLINHLIKNGAVPSSIQNPTQGLAIVKFGREIGLQPMMAFNAISVVKGKMYQASEYLGGLFRKRGYDFRLVEYSKERSVIKAKDKYDVWFEFEYTLDQATEEGNNKAKVGKDGTNYNKYETSPARMLYLRNIRQAVTTLAPELLLGTGVDNIEEVEQENIPTEPIKEEEKEKPPLEEVKGPEDQDIPDSVEVENIANQILRDGTDTDPARTKDMKKVLENGMSTKYVPTADPELEIVDPQTDLPWEKKEEPKKEKGFSEKFADDTTEELISDIENIRLDRGQTLESIMKPMFDKFDTQNVVDIPFHDLFNFVAELKKDHAEDRRIMLLTNEEFIAEFKAKVEEAKNDEDLNLILKRYTTKKQCTPALTASIQFKRKKINSVSK